MSRTRKDTPQARYKHWMATGVPSWFKQMWVRARRAKDKETLRNGQEAPKWRRTDEYNWW